MTVNIESELSQLNIDQSKLPNSPDSQNLLNEINILAHSTFINDMCSIQFQGQHALLLVKENIIFIYTLGLELLTTFTTEMPILLVFSDNNTYFLISETHIYTYENSTMICSIKHSAEYMKQYSISQCSHYLSSSSNKLIFFSQKGTFSLATLTNGKMSLLPQASDSLYFDISNVFQLQEDGRNVVYMLARTTTRDYLFKYSVSENRPVCEYEYTMIPVPAFSYAFNFKNKIYAVLSDKIYLCSTNRKADSPGSIAALFKSQKRDKLNSHNIQADDSKSYMLNGMNYHYVTNIGYSDICFHTETDSKAVFFTQKGEVFSISSLETKAAVKHEISLEENFIKAVYCQGCHYIITELNFYVLDADFNILTKINIKSKSYGIRKHKDGISVKTDTKGIKIIEELQPNREFSEAIEVCKCGTLFDSVLKLLNIARSDKIRYFKEGILVLNDNILYCLKDKIYSFGACDDVVDFVLQGSNIVLVDLRKRVRTISLGHAATCNDVQMQDLGIYQENNVAYFNNGVYRVGEEELHLLYETKGYICNILPFGQERDSLYGHIIKTTKNIEFYDLRLKRMLHISSEEHTQPDKNTEMCVKYRLCDSFLHLDMINPESEKIIPNTDELYMAGSIAINKKYHAVRLINLEVQHAELRIMSSRKCVIKKKYKDIPYLLETAKNLLCVAFKNSIIVYKLKNKRLVKISTLPNLGIIAAKIRYLGSRFLGVVGRMGTGYLVDMHEKKIALVENAHDMFIYKSKLGTVYNDAIAVNEVEYYNGTSIKAVKILKGRVRAHYEERKRESKWELVNVNEITRLKAGSARERIMVVEEGGKIVMLE
ncbi:hypothetical protein ENBRE01_1964 [Enteropsectra breve]|nr:hypothetical protein ENBRE01_1964 [Enteropsectra breve]